MTQRTGEARDVVGQIREVVLSWSGVTEGEHEFGGVEFRVGKREIGHLHDDLDIADFPFPVRVREELVRAGQARPHHIFPRSGWVSYSIPDDDSVAGALTLFRLAYERAIAARRGVGQAEERPTPTSSRPDVRSGGDTEKSG